MNETTFAPNDPITREQIAAILYRYAHEENTEDGKLTSFPDAKDISGYALEAMNWAVARGLINGSDGKLLPQDTAAPPPRAPPAGHRARDPPPVIFPPPPLPPHPPGGAPQHFLAIGPRQTICSKIELGRNNKP